MTPLLFVAVITVDPVLLRTWLDAPDERPVLVVYYYGTHGARVQNEWWNRAESYLQDLRNKYPPLAFADHLELIADRQALILGRCTRAELGDDALTALATFDAEIGFDVGVLPDSAEASALPCPRMRDGWKLTHRLARQLSIFETGSEWAVCGPWRRPTTGTGVVSSAGLLRDRLAIVWREGETWKRGDFPHVYGEPEIRELAGEPLPHMVTRTGPTWGFARFEAVHVPSGKTAVCNGVEWEDILSLVEATDGITATVVTERGEAMGACPALQWSRDATYVLPLRDGELSVTFYSGLPPNPDRGHSFVIRDAHFQWFATAVVRGSDGTIRARRRFESKGDESHPPKAMVVTDGKLVGETTWSPRGCMANEWQFERYSKNVREQISISVSDDGKIELKRRDRPAQRTKCVPGFD